MDFKKAFKFIYDNKIWGDGSGGGSYNDDAKQFALWLNDFTKEKGVKSIIDFGCGHWAYMDWVDLTGIDYTGIDCVESVIKENNKLDIENATFILSDKLEGECDLLIIKEVFQHWPDSDIIKFMDSVDGFKYLVLMNTTGEKWHSDTSPAPTENRSVLLPPLDKYGFKVVKMLANQEISIKTI